MSKQTNKQQDVFAPETTSKIEKFFVNHKKKIIAAVIIIAVAVIGIFVWKHIDEKNEIAAQEELANKSGNTSTPNPDHQRAIDDYLKIIKEYPSTKAGNLANHYVGIQYLRMGDLDNANKYLKAYKPVGGSIHAEIINAQNIGLQGDVAVEKGNYAEAAKLFKKAVNTSSNSFTAPYYLYKQALALEAAGDIEGAKACYKTITEKYPEAVEYAEATKRL
jgi:TolA-binding protein